MLKIANVPNEIWLAALDYEGIDRPDDPAKARETYARTVEKRHWTDGGLARAISDYLRLDGPFSEENGEFAGVGGYEIA